MSDAHTLQEEDGFHEIQLNGKQLVFLGMTTTLVSVVIFLCGVLVGRGVKPIQPTPETAPVQTAFVADPAPAPVPEPPAPDPAPVPAAAVTAAVPPVTEAPAPAPPAAATPKAQAAAQPARPEAEPVDELSYYDALSKGDKGRARATAKTTEATAKTTEQAAKTTEAAPKPAAAVAAAVPPAIDDAPVAAPARPAGESGGAIAVQVAALTSRSDAEAVARKLSGKGYAAYVLAPESGAKQVFKVRVGNYASADEAARVSRKLREEEKLQPWVIR